MSVVENRCWVCNDITQEELFCSDDCKAIEIAAGNSAVIDMENMEKTHIFNWIKAVVDLEKPLLQQDYSFARHEDPFKEKAEEILGVPWETAKKLRKLILDQEDTLYYEFPNHYIFRCEIGVWSIFKIYND